jgi:hypothetical protein
LENQNKIDPMIKKKVTLQHKIEVSIKETEMFEDDV